MTSFESFQASRHHAFNGLELVIVRAKEGQAGRMTLKATSEGLTAPEITVEGK